jgi:hypothetical protein
LALLFLKRQCDRTLGTCPADGEIDMGLALVDYILAVDALPSLAGGRLAALAATNNAVLAHSSPAYDWLTYDLPGGSPMTSSSLSDHEARAVVLHHPYKEKPSASTAATTQSPAAAAGGLILAAAVAACAL